MLLALVVVSSGLLGCLLGHSAHLATRAAQAALLDADADAAGLTVRTRLGEDPAAQDQVARDQLATGFAPAPVTVFTAWTSEPVAASFQDQALSQRLTLASGNLFDDGLSLVDGRWPASDAEAALHSSAAEALGVSVGDVIRVGATELQLSATWTPADVTDPRWLGDPLVTGGSNDQGAGPLLVSDAVLQATGSPFIAWTVLPDAAHITPAELDTLASGAERAKELVGEADVTGRGITVEGDLAPAAQQAALDRSVGAGFRLVPLSVVLLVALVGLAQVASLLAAARDSETRLLFARGASLRQVAGAGVAEAVLVAVAGSAVGTVLAIGIVGGLAASLQHSGTVALGGAIGLALAIVALGAVAVRSAIDVGRDERMSTGRLRAIAGAASLVLVCVLAAVSAWQLWRSDRFLTVADGEVQVDFVAAIAPALLIGAAAIASLVLLAPVTRILELLTRRGSTGLWLAGAQVARALRLYAVPVVLTVLATATAMFAALFAGTSAQLQRDVASLTQGAPVRALLSGAVGDYETPWSLPDADGLTGSTPVWRADAASIGNLTIPALAAPTAALTEVATLPGGARVPVLPGVAGDDATLPTDADSLTVRLEATGQEGMSVDSLVTVTVTLRDPHTGIGSRVEALALTLAPDATASAEATIALPPDIAVSLDAVNVRAVGVEALDARLAITAGPATLLDEQLDEWDVDGWDAVANPIAPDMATEVPAALTAATAAATSLEVGDRLDLGAFGLRFTAVVTDIVEDLPALTGGTGVLVDSAELGKSLAATGRWLGHPSELWADGDAQARAELASAPAVTQVAAPVQVSADSPSAVATGSLRLASVAAVALALTGLAAASGTQLRTRRSEVAVLRAIGMTPRSQARSRAWESGGIIGLAALAGLAGGWGVGALTVGPLAASTARGSIWQPDLILDWPTLVMPLVLGLVAACVVVAVLGRAVGRQAQDCEYREEVR